MEKFGTMTPQISAMLIDWQGNNILRVCVFTLVKLICSTCSEADTPDCICYRVTRY
jgi:hypothetical protein